MATSPQQQQQQLQIYYEKTFSISSSPLDGGLDGWLKPKTLLPLDNTIGYGLANAQILGL
jgi:hypothetical protein